jgi:hypothetical protein
MRHYGHKFVEGFILHGDGSRGALPDHDGDFIGRAAASVGSSLKTFISMTWVFLDC